MLLKTVLYKFCNLLFAFFLTLSLTFFLMKLIPGDPFTNPQGVPREIVAAMHEHYGFNDPLLVQYGRYLVSAAHGDLGPSFKYKDRKVSDIIKAHFPVSARLGLQALVMSLVFGITCGWLSAVYCGRKLDTAFMLLATILISVPSFLLAAFMQYLFAIKLGWLPIARWGSFAQTVLPSIALSALPTAFIARLTRSSLLDVMGQNYIKTAIAKGMSRTQVVLRHALPNALLPVISFLGFDIMTILSGSFIIEKIYGVPGIGQSMVLAVTNRDYTVIMGLTIFYSAIFLISIFLADLFSMMLDPRQRTPQSIKRRPHG